MIEQLRRHWAIESLSQLEFFQSIQWLDQVDSTNRYLDRQIKASQIRLPSIAVADTQTAGAGRSGNPWYSPQGCLMFSMAIEHSWLQSQNNPDALPLLPLQVGLAVAHALSPLVSNQPKVKWPNDVYVDDRKICGILIESGSVFSKGYVIIGVGINCKVDFGLSPMQVRQSAVSLHEVFAGQDQESISCESVLIAFMQSWLELDAWCRSQPDWIQRNWSKWDWLADRNVQVQQPTGVLIGKADGIGKNGSLRLIDSHANRLTILSGTVRVID
jgi:BirA family biotin operon repressor/biotin-[acetyl-CoA-carboxylase] ligase